MDVQASLEAGGGNEADDVDFNEAVGEEFAQMRSESVDVGLESDGDDDKSTGGGGSRLNFGQECAAHSFKMAPLARLILVKMIPLARLISTSKVP